ncbi:unnamed protein product [Cunninghamella blakesleeana]
MSDILNSMYKALGGKKRRPSTQTTEEMNQKPLNQQTSMSSNPDHIEQRIQEHPEEDHPHRQMHHEDKDDYSYGFIIG